MHSAHVPFGPSSRLHRAAFWLLTVLLSLALLVHSALIQISNFPMTPVKLDLQPLLDRYVSPYFAQNWSFFAPTPLDHSLSMVTRGEYLSPDGTKMQTGWVNVSDPLFTAVGRNRFTPLGMISLMLSNTVVDFKNQLSGKQDATFKRNGVTYIRSVVPASVDPLDAQVMNRTGMAVLKAAHPDYRFSRVQVGIVDDTYPRFTRRNDPTAKHTASFFAVEWQPAPDVEGFCCVQVDRAVLPGRTK